MSSKICYEWLNRLQCAGVPFLCDLTSARTSAPRFRERLLKLRDGHADNEAARAVFDDIEAWRGTSRSMVSTTLVGVPVTPLDDPSAAHDPGADADQPLEQEITEEPQEGKATPEY